MKTLLSVLVGVNFALASAAGSAEETDKDVLKLSIERKSLRDALNDWAQQTGYQLIAEIRGEFVAPKVEGRLTAQEALERLLEGTPLTYQWMGERLVAVKEKDRVLPAALQSTGADGKDQAPIRVARLTGDELGRVRVGATDPRGAQNPEGSPVQRGPRHADRELEELEEVVVTGTHIRGVANRTVPITVLDRAYIQSTGITTTTRLMESLPQNFALANQSVVFTPDLSVDGAQGSSINLRGIGEGTTLTLLNGHRLAPGFNGAAVDISAIPLAAIERVEILTDGASAIYGSDAVGGVVNFVLRRDFSGAETSIRSGWADGSLNEHTLSQVVGGAWGTGNALASVQYYKRDLLEASDRDFVPATSLIGSLLPRDEVYSATISARQGLGESVSAFADALYTRRESFNEAGQPIFDVHTEIDNPQLAAIVGLDWMLGQDWQLQASVSDSHNRMHADLFNALGDRNNESTFELRAAQLKADGSVFELPGGRMRVAVGVDWRSERYESLTNAAGMQFELDVDQTVRSAFGELYIPLVGDGNAMRGVKHLDLSIAGRLDDYSNFGSSFDPKLGIMWAPADGVRVRASYGTSYKAPNLRDYDVRNSNQGFGVFGPDPASPTGTSYRLSLFGTDPESFKAQESRSTSLGLEFAPSALRGLELGLNYYKIRYSNRIADPTFDSSAALADPVTFAELITRSPSLEQVNSAIAVAQLGFGFIPFDENFEVVPNFDPAAIDVIVDLRRRNLSFVETSGVDFYAEYDFDIERGHVQLGVASTYIIERIDQITRTSPSVDTIDTIYHPPSWRLRASAGWQSAGWSANLFANYTDAYIDNRTPEAATISSYATLDARLAYQFSQEGNRGLLSGLTIAVNVQNLLDNDPPRTAVLTPELDLGFDPTNATALGRFIAVELLKKW